MLAIISFIVSLVLGIFFFCMLIFSDTCKYDGLWGGLSLIMIPYGFCGLLVIGLKPSFMSDVSMYYNEKAKIEILKSDTELPCYVISDYIDGIERMNKRIDDARRWKCHPYMGVFYNEEVAGFEKLKCDTIRVRVISDEEYLKRIGK